MGGQTKTAKKDYFFKILSPPRFFEINTSNFQKMFLDILKKIAIKNKKKNYFLFIFYIIFLFIKKKNFSTEF